MRDIKVRISPTVNRKRFDLELTHDGVSTTYENSTRGEIHDLVREAVNNAFDSLQ